MAEVTERSRWELAAESTVVKLRWFGIVMGYILVQTRSGLHDPWAVRAFLALGAGYAALDLAFWRMGEVILKGWPLLVSGMESLFIALLCYHDTGLDSPFRWYYLLSLICCSIRNRPVVAWWTLGFHCVSLLGLAWVLGASGRPVPIPFLTLTIMAWVTWASSSLAGSLRAAGEELARLNGELARSPRGAGAPGRGADDRAAGLAGQGHPAGEDGRLRPAGRGHRPRGGQSPGRTQLAGPDAPAPRAGPYTAGKLDLAGRQLQRIERTVRELVDFSRPASSKASRVRVAEVVEEALGIAKYYQRTKQRSITTDVPVDLPAVVVLRDHLTQVVLNLVLNAIDATEEQGKVHVEAHVEGRWLVLTVEDDGRGISLADRCRIFQPFFTTKPHGTGLGLFVSRQILEDVSGQLGYRSEPGQGSTFIVRLPLEPADGPRRRRRAAIDGQRRGEHGYRRGVVGAMRSSVIERQNGTAQTDETPATRGRILIVDDEEVISGTLHEFLQGEQFEVATAANMPGALALVESFGPDVVLCDVQLPGGDGLTVLERSLRIRPETLFIMITAYATVENAVAAFRRGAQDYLMKPVLFEDLLAKLDRLIAYRRLLMENQALRRQLHPQGDLDALVGGSPPMQAVKTLIRKVGPTRSTVLITGESGTGKELVARALHASGPAPDGLFLAINCAAIPHDLLENQLFGHVRGAFTGADRDHAGLFVAAGPGTVFLDEIGELSRIDPGEAAPRHREQGGPAGGRHAAPSRSRPG